MIKLMLTIGMSGSGKTTWAESYVRRHPNCVNLNRDSLRQMIFGLTQRTIHRYKYTKARESLVTSMQLQLAKQSLVSKKSVIISDTNLSLATRKKWKQFSKDNGVPYEEVMFDVPVEVCQERNLKRRGSVPAEVIYKQWAKFRAQFKSFDIYTPNDYSEGEAIICDIDGTLAHMGANRSPFEWDKVGQDSVDLLVKGYINYQATQGISIVILSGRDRCCGEATIEWLINNGITYEYLFMREEGDKRKDTIVKRELFDRFVSPKFDVIQAIDDRPCMVDMWNDMGITTWAVADQRNKF